MLINIDEFIKKYDGKFLEVAGSANAKNQCVDLANGYIRECLNLPIIEWTNAQDFPTKAGNNFNYILNTPDGVPQKGDLIIWSSADGVGHIAIFVEGDANSFRSFDQNYPLASSCHIQSHTYLRPKVIGWMRAINNDSVRIERDSHWNRLQKLLNAIKENLPHENN